MNNCLLCLKLTVERSGVVNVSSSQWLEENVEKIIEKYFWPLKSITSTAFMCCICWKILREFHKFHKTIENAHEFYSQTVLKAELTETFENAATNVSEIMQNEFEIPVEGSSFNKTTNNFLILKNETLNSNIVMEDDELSIADNIEEEDPLQKQVKSSICTKTPRKQASSRRKKRTKHNSNTKKTAATDTENQKDCEKFLENFVDESTVLCTETALHSEEQNKFVSENFTVQCGICRCPMKTFLDVCKHSAREHQQRGFVVCCNKKFFRRSILVEHLNWHINPEYFKCKDCGKVLADRRCLEVHARVHEELERTHICDVCSKAFARPMALTRHKLSHLPHEERKFPCKYCAKKFGNNDLLVEHTRSAHLTKQAWICYICGKVMRTKAVYKRHLQQHEGIPPPTFICDICGLKVTNIHRLKIHKETKHPEGGPKEYNCHLCSKISPSPKALRAHIRYKHELGLDFKCNICDKAFKRALSLKEHMATHTGTELYTCPYCPKTFKSNANMHGHRKKAHPDKWEEVYREKYSGNLPENLRISTS